MTTQKQPQPTQQKLWTSLQKKIQQGTKQQPQNKQEIITKTNKKEFKLTITISYSEKFHTKTIRIENKNLFLDFTKTGEKSRWIKLIFNKIKGRLQLGKTKNSDIGTTTKELKTFLQSKSLLTDETEKIIDTMERNIDKINDLLDNDEKGQFEIK